MSAEVNTFESIKALLRQSKQFGQAIIASCTGHEQLHHGVRAPLEPRAHCMEPHDPRELHGV